MKLFEPLLRCRLCWRVTAAVFVLILVVESVLLIPSAQRFERTERQRLADHAQILVDPLLARADADGATPPLDSAIGRYGLRAVSVHAASGRLLFHAEAPAGAAPEEVFVTTWRSSAFGGASVTATIDASSIRRELLEYVLRIAGLVAIIVLVVTLGTMLVLDMLVLRPLLRLRQSSLDGAADPEGAALRAPQTGRRDELGDLVRAHREMLEQVADSRRRDREMAEERARFLTRHDAATGLPNRAAVLEHCDRRRAAGAGTLLLLVNLRGFRGFNAGHGAAAGDRLIGELAQRLQRAAAAGDFVARLGADRFVVASDERPMQQTAAYVEGILQALSLPFRAAPEVVTTPAACIGIAHGEVLSGEELLTQAELALARTYEDGGGRYAFFSAELAAQSRERQELTRDLERALERGELFPVFQPKVRLGAPGGGLAGAEVLLRWRHPERGMVSPGVFIPLAEASGLIVALGDFVLRASCTQARAWRTRYGASPRVAVNLSAQQFAQADLTERLERTLTDCGVSPELVEFEITETSAMRDAERTAAVLARMRAAGMRVSIDDFGTGYSSLNYLRRFAVDAIKIDKSFVDDIGVDRHAEAICDAILRLGHSLGTKVIAEGVEREEQASFLRRRRCDEAQGWLFGKPLAAQEFEHVWLAAAANA